MDIILTGSTGKLGGALWRAWAEDHNVRTLRRDMVDLRHPEALWHFLEGTSFDVLVNCAAIANPETCRIDPDEAFRVNAEAPGVLASICQDRGARLVHFSTDYVLEGSEPGLKDEHAPTGPLDHYGQTKLEGEHRVLDHDPAALVCRVSWIFGSTPPGFLETILARAQAGEELEAVADKFSMPTGVADIAAAVIALLDRPELCGLFHLTNLGEPQSWWSYGTRVLELAHELGLLDEVKEVRQKTLADLPQLTTPRPIHTAMRPARLMNELGLSLRPWEEAARERLLDLLG